ncbi:MAG: PAP2 family protein, partial [Rhizobiales bacterium]|nr:PAP2 family protein [Hyphomicrobiales bacterium]
MNRTGLIIALAIGGVAAIVFTLAPQLDLAATRALMSPDAFAFRASPLQNALRGIAIALIWITVAAPVLALLLKLALPHRPMLLRGRTVVLLIVT